MTTPKVKPITGRQKEALDFINSFINTKGYSPSLRELASLLKTDNLSTAQYFVKELESKGYIRRAHYKNRGITPVTQKRTIPLLGYIAAGEPIDPIEESEPIQVPYDIKLDRNQSYYALKVQGDSMIDMGILDRDVVLIRHQMFAADGDVVVAITENGATLKILRKNKKKMYLEARNTSYQHIYPEQLEIRGKFIGLIRHE
ncbi:repressor LexA [bacterium]|nr:repressor LexA [bacterium]